jgi:hypothetical protein
MIKEQNRPFWGPPFLPALLLLLIGLCLAPVRPAMACASQRSVISGDNPDSIQANLIYYHPGLSEGIYLFTIPQRIPSGEAVDLLFNFGLCLPPNNQPLVSAEGEAYEVDPRQDCLFYSDWLPLHSLDENRQTINVLQDIFMVYMTDEFTRFFSHIEGAEHIQPYFDQYVRYLTAYTEYLTIAIGVSLIRRGRMGATHPALRTSPHTTWTRATGWTLLVVGLYDLLSPAIIEGFQIRENHHRKRWQDLQEAMQSLNEAMASLISQNAMPLPPSSSDSHQSEEDMESARTSPIPMPEPLNVESRLRTFLEDAIEQSLQQTWGHSPGVCVPTMEFYRDFTFINLSLTSNRRIS